MAKTPNGESAWEAGWRQVRGRVSSTPDAESVVAVFVVAFRDDGALHTEVGSPDLDPMGLLADAVTRAISARLDGGGRKPTKIIVADPGAVAPIGRTTGFQVEHGPTPRVDKALTDFAHRVSTATLSAANDDDLAINPVERKAKQAFFATAARLHRVIPRGQISRGRASVLFLVYIAPHARMFLCTLRDVGHVELWFCRDTEHLQAIVDAGVIDRTNAPLFSLDYIPTWGVARESRDELKALSLELASRTAYPALRAFGDNGRQRRLTSADFSVVPVALSAIHVALAEAAGKPLHVIHGRELQLVVDNWDGLAEVEVRTTVNVTR